MSGKPSSSPATSEVRVSLGYRPFQLPPVGDGLLVGKRASIGPTALFESMERLLPGMYELVAVEGHPVVEAAIVLTARFRMLGRDKLIALIVRHGENLMDATSCMQLTIDGEVMVSVAVEQ